MHDHRAIEALMERLAGREHVAEVRVRAGPAYEPEALEQAYEMLTRDTPLAGSRLAVERADLECAECGTAADLTDLAGGILLCPSCGTVSRPERLERLEVLTVLAVGPSALRC